MCTSTFSKLRRVSASGDRCPTTLNRTGLSDVTVESRITMNAVAHFCPVFAWSGDGADRRNPSRSAITYVGRTLSEVYCNGRSQPSSGCRRSRSWAGRGPGRHRCPRIVRRSADSWATCQCRPETWPSASMPRGSRTDGRRPRQPNTLTSARMLGVVIGSAVDPRSA